MFKISTTVWQELEPILQRFEEAWQRGESPSLEDYLPATEPLRRAALLELIRMDLEFRLRARQQVRVESYLQRYPELEGDPVVLEFITLEYRLRWRAYDTVTPEEYLGRFPQQGENLLARLRSLSTQDLQTEPPDPPTPIGPVPLPATASSGQSAPFIPGYEILGVLGRGGMGIVYKARQVKLNRVVALKMIWPGHPVGAELLARFRQEAEAVAQLQHPNIVQIYEIGEQEGLPFFSLEYVDGGTLAERLKGTPLPAAQAAQLVETLARAMSQAHQHGIVHRDLKPGNILLSGQQQDVPLLPKITDFGLAKRLDSEQQTRPGVILGTPSYMAPEQVSGEVINSAADIYALGAILYECLTGRPPFKAATAVETLAQVQNDDPAPPTRLQRQVPRDLETICLKCLHKQPGKRYASALDLAADLRRYLDGRPILARPTSLWEHAVKWAGRHPGVASLLAVVGLTVVLAFVVVAWEWRRTEGQRRLTAAALAETETQLYLQRIAFAEREWQAGNVASVETLLERCPPRLRQWEWHYLERLCHTDLLRCSGQDSVAISPDGRLLATPSDRDISIRDASTGQLLHVLGGHTGRVTRVAFDPALPGGSRLASASEDGTIKVWNPETGTELHSWDGHPGSVVAVAFSRDGKLLASCSQRQVQIRDAATGAVRQRLEGHTGQVSDVAFSPDGSRLASASWDGTVRLWDTGTGQVVAVLAGHQGKVAAVRFHPTGGQLATAGDDQTVRLWDVATKQEVRTLLGHRSRTTCVAFSPDGRLLASGAGDFLQPGEITVWDSATGQQLRRIRGHNSRVRSLAFDRQGNRLAAADETTVKVWDVTTDQEAVVLRCDGRSVGSVAVSPDGQFLATAGGDGLVQLWNVQSREALTPLAGHVGPADSVAFAPDGRRLASAGDDQTVKLWDRLTGKELHTLRGHTGWAWGVAFSPDGSLLASASADQTVRLWDAGSGESVAVLRGHTNHVSSVAFRPDGKLLASGSHDQTVKLWDVASRQEWRTLEGHRTAISCVAFSPDGRLLATGGGNQNLGEIFLWDATSGVELKTWPGHAGRVMSLAFSSDGRRLASASWDQTVKLWDKDSGQEVISLRGHRGPVTGVVFGPDQSWLASCSVDQTVRLWGLPAGVGGK